MGSLCNKDIQKENNSTAQTSRNENTNLKEERLKNEKELTEKICSKEEFAVWKDLNDLELVKLKSLNSKTRKVEFDLTDIDYHEITFLGQIIYLFDKKDNFLLFPKIFEILIGIIDFLQVVLDTKKKHNIKSFFLIYFSKFIFVNENKVTKIKYVCSRLNEPFTGPELLFKHDKIMSSMSIYDSTKSFMNMMSQKSTSSIDEEPDLNSYFYSKAKNLYNNVRDSNYSFKEIEYFYSDVIMNFINRFLLKKSSISIKELNYDFTLIKNLLRACFKEIRKEKLSLQQLKEFLVSIQMNNYEFCVLNNKINNLFNKKDQDEMLYSKIIEYNNLEFNFIYGNCATTSTKGHSFSFIYDRLIEKINDPVCMKCAWTMILKRIKKDEKISLSELDRQLKDKSSISINLFYFIKYACFLQPIQLEDHLVTDTHNMTNLSYLSHKKQNLKVKEFSDLLENKKDEIYISKKNDISLTFEIIYYDDDRELFDLISFDMKIKEIITNKNKKVENSILYPDSSKSNNNSIVNNSSVRFSKLSGGEDNSD